MNSTVKANQMAEQSLNTVFHSIGNPLGGLMIASQAAQNISQLGNALSQDGISRFAPTTQQMLNLNPIGNPFDPVGSMITRIQTLIDMLKQMLGGGNSSPNNFLLGQPGIANPGGSGFPGGIGRVGDNEQWFNTAAAGSNGDPHLSFNGQTWDSMVPQPDLLHSDSIPGGFQVATQTTAPAPNGVTYNQQATVSTNFGNSSISLDNSGNCIASVNGQQMNLAPGQSVALGYGTTATRNQDGSLTVLAQNDAGGVISTTLRQNGQGVDVNASAQNVDLGGDLVNHNGAGVFMPFGHAQHGNHLRDGEATARRAIAVDPRNVSEAF